MTDPLEKWVISTQPFTIKKNQLHSCIGKYTYNRPMDAMGKPSIIMVA